MPGTGVVMADGSVKAIDDVAVGDTVVAVAADGTRAHRQVVATITGHGAKDLVGLTLVGSGGGGPPAGETITATDGHLFLTAGGEWVPAKGLQVGDQLVDPDGTPVAIAAIEDDSVVATVHNLTIDTDHTYTVATGAGTDVVTHNDSVRYAMRGPQATNACPTGSAPRTPDGKYATRTGEQGRDGAADERAAWDQLEVDGADVRRGETHVSIPGLGVRKYDGTVQIDGQWFGIEVKGGTATRRPNQRAADDWLNTPGNSVQTKDGRTLVGVFDVWIDR